MTNPVAQSPALDELVAIEEQEPEWGVAFHLEHLRSRQSSRYCCGLDERWNDRAAADVTRRLSTTAIGVQHDEHDAGVIHRVPCTTTLRINRHERLTRADDPSLRWQAFRARDPFIAVARHPKQQRFGARAARQERTGERCYRAHATDSLSLGVDGARPRCGSTGMPRPRSISATRAL